MAETDYNVIRVGIAAFLSSNLTWIVSTDQIFDYSPTDPALVFGHLPAIIVDFDQRASIAWVEVTQGYERGISFLVEVYAEIEQSDTTAGRAASQNIVDRLNDIETLLAQHPSLDTLVKGTSIRSSKVETLTIEATKLGIKARFAWVSFVVFALI